MIRMFECNATKKKKKVYFPNFAGWTPNKQFCFSKSAPFRILSPHSKLRYHICSQVVKQWWTWSCGFRVTCSRSQRSDFSLLLFLFCFSPPNALFFVTDHTTKLGMKDLLKAQQWWVERDSILIPPQYMPNALTTTPCSPSYAPHVVAMIMDERPRMNHQCQLGSIAWFERMCNLFEPRSGIVLRLGNGIFPNVMVFFQSSFQKLVRQWFWKYSCHF